MPGQPLPGKPQFRVLGLRLAAATACFAAVCWVASCAAVAADPVAGKSDESAVQRGYRLLRTKAYLSADFPVAAFDTAYKLWPQPLREQAEKATPLARRKMALSRYGLPQRRANPRERRWVTSTMAAAAGRSPAWHATAARWRGKPSLAWATRTMPSARSRPRCCAVGPHEGQQARCRSAPEPANAALGRNQRHDRTGARTFSVLLTSLRDDEMNVVPDAKPAPVRASRSRRTPLWNASKKRLYIDGFVEKSPRTIMQFISTPKTTRTTIKGWEPDFADILAWIESIEPPKWP